MTKHKRRTNESPGISAEPVGARREGEFALTAVRPTQTAPASSPDSVGKSVRKATQAAQETGSSARGIMYMLLLGFALVTLLTACGLASKDGDHDHAKLHGSELWETTASVNTLPGFLDDQTKLTKDLYAATHEHADIMSVLSCYCGCMMGTEFDEPHDSLLRCYWAEHPADEGSVTWTNHSSSCGICKMEMEQVIALKKQGKTADEIREAIDASFKPKRSSES